MKHRSNPAWSFGTRTPAEPMTTNKLAPPPDSYNVRPEEIEVPTHAFGTGPKGDLFPIPDFPGPGNYDLKRFMDQRAEDKGNKRRHKRQAKPATKQDTRTKFDTPGPGAYNPAKPLRNISTSMGNRTHMPDRSSNPLGPGSHNPDVRPVTANVKTFSIGKGNRPPIYNTNQYPAPWTYAIRPHTTGTYRIGNAARGQRGASEDVPGPGAYDMTDTIGDRQGKTIIPRRPPISNKGEVPGPGAHQIESVGGKGLAFSIGTGERSSFIQSKKMPSPCDYNPHHVAHVSKSSSFGTGKRPPLNKSYNTPGPGSYEYRNTIGNTSKYTLTGRKAELKGLMDNPGPGAYDPLIDPVQKRASAHVVGTGARSNSNRLRPKTTPGPGAYFSAADVLHAKQWTFNKDPRSRFRDDDEPGPGQYDIPPTVPDAPYYLMRSPNKRGG